MSGIGDSPFGLGPYGLGTPAVAPAQGGALLVDQAGEGQGSRYIDGRTRDFVADQYGRLVGMGNTKQLVQLAVSTEYGSAATIDLGHKLREIQRISDNFTKAVDNVLRTALRKLTDGGLIAILSIDVQRLRSQGGAFARVRWRDLQTGVEDTEIVT